MFRSFGRPTSYFIAGILHASLSLVQVYLILSQNHKLEHVRSCSLCSTPSQFLPLPNPKSLLSIQYQNQFIFINELSLNWFEYFNTYLAQLFNLNCFWVLTHRSRIEFYLSLTRSNPTMGYAYLNGIICTWNNKSSPFIWGNLVLFWILVFFFYLDSYSYCHVILPL